MMAVTDYLKGSGSVDDPYIIHNLAAAVQYWNLDIKTACYAELVTDVDMAGITIAGSYAYDWPGNLNGNGFCISNLDWHNQSGSPAKVNGIYKNLKLLNWTGYNNSILSFNNICENLEIIKQTGIANYNLYGSATKIKNCLSVGNIAITERSSGATVEGCYCIGGSFIRATDLSAAANKNDPTLYPALLSTDWVKDGASIPRLLHKINPAFTQSYVVKGVTKVAGQAKSRRCRLHSPVDFNQISSVLSGVDGSYLLKCGYYSDSVYVTHSDDYGYKLQVNKSYVIGDVVHPITPNGYRYKCTTAGTTSASFPMEPWSTSSNLVFGTAIFTPEPVYKAETFLVVPKLYDLLTGQPV